MSDRLAHLFSRRLSLFYAALFLGIGIYQPYFPIWLKGRGLDAAQISIILATPMTIRVFLAPVSGYLADRRGERRPMIIGCTWLSATFFFLLGLDADFLWIFVWISMAALFWTSIMPLTEAFALQGVRRFGADYGRIRLWGSVSFIAANFIAGLILDMLAFPVIHKLILAAMAITVLVGHALPRLPGSRTVAGERSRAGGRQGGSAPGDVLVVLLAAGMLQASHALLYGFGSLYWQDAGFSGVTIGFLWALGVVAEIAFFAWSRHLPQSVTPLVLMAAGAVAALVRWTGLSLAPPLAGLVGLQALHGLTFGATHLGTMRFIGQMVPEHHTATAQGAFFTISGLCMGASMLASGALYDEFGGRAFLAMAVPGAAALAVLWVARGRFHPHSSAGGG